MPALPSKASPWCPVATPHTSSTCGFRSPQPGPSCTPTSPPSGMALSVFPCLGYQGSWGGEGRATLARTLSPVLRWWHSRLSMSQTLSLCHEGSALSPQYSGCRSGTLPAPRLAQRAWRSREGCTLRGYGEGPRAERGTSLARAGGELRPGLAGGTGGARGTRLAGGAQLL